MITLAVPRDYKKFQTPCGEGVCKTGSIRSYVTEFQTPYDMNLLYHTFRHL